jgi:hypothetical protein
VDVTVAILSWGSIRDSDTPELCSGTLSLPLHIYQSLALRADVNVGLHAVSKYAVSKDGQTIRPSFHTYNADPVLLV